MKDSYGVITMKKILVSAFAAVASAAAFAGMNNVVITFSTPGPDKYSDGTTVVDGEKYALVWTPDGETFAGINADGTAAGASKVVFAVPAAVGGRCPRVEFQVDEDYVASKYPNGTWGVVMLDTRTFLLDADGKPVILDGNRKVDSVGGTNEVNGYGVIGEVKAARGGDVCSSGGVAAASGAAAADTPAPKVKSVSFDENYVYVTITATKPAFKYTLAAGDEPDAIVEKPCDPSTYGSAKDVILVKPKKAGGEFFKVNCK